MTSHTSRSDHRPETSISDDPFLTTAVPPRDVGPQQVEVGTDPFMSGAYPAPPQHSQTAVPNDPFLSHAQPAVRSQAEPDMRTDPFQTGARATSGTSVTGDAFLTGDRAATPSSIGFDPFHTGGAAATATTPVGGDEFFTGNQAATPTPVTEDTFFTGNQAATPTPVTEDTFFTGNQAATPTPVTVDTFFTGNRATEPQPVNNDPFMTGDRGRTTPLEAVTADPFFTGDRGQTTPVQGVVRDPFSTGRNPTSPTGPVQVDPFFTGNQSSTAAPLQHDPFWTGTPGEEVRPIDVQRDPYLTGNLGEVEQPGAVGPDPFFTGARASQPMQIHNDPYFTGDPNQDPDPVLQVDTNPFMTNAEIIQEEGDAQRNVVGDPFLMHDIQPPDVDANVVKEPFMVGPLGQPDPNQPVTSDPFLTHDNPVPEQPYGVRRDPFMMKGGEPEEQTEIKRDPFMTSPDYCPEDVLVQEDNRWEEMCEKRSQMWIQVMGYGDPERDQQDGLILVLWPWFVFMWVLLMWLILRHFSMVANIALTSFVVATCFLMVLLWCFGRRSHRVPLITLGTLCLFGAIAGIYVGVSGWDWYWRQYWWMSTGAHIGNSTASSPGASRIDASVIGFGNGRLGHSPTSVDYTRSAGYRDGHVYCAAPILEPDLVSSGLTKVNFWALGVDCCDDVGGFTCDDSRMYQGSYGVVLLEGGFPCPTCNTKMMMAAVAKAESTHRLTSSKSPQFVRWVRDPNKIHQRYFIHAIAFLLVAATIAFFVFLFLGSLAWYHGIGKIRDRSSESAFLIPFAIQKLSGKPIV